jgi:putative phosphoesterase
MTESTILAGIISDTHGLMRPEALAALLGSDLIIHAGDLGSPDVIDSLRAIAPVFAVRGNVDTGNWAAQFPLTQTVAVGALRIHVLHDISELAIDPAIDSVAAVVFGHSHQPMIETRGNVLFLNPGSAGPRRFRLPVTLARVKVTGTELRPELVTLI